MSTPKYREGPYIPAQQPEIRAADMSLRDWFAGQALAGLLACPETSASSMEIWGRDCYRFADAMLEARKAKA